MEDMTKQKPGRHPLRRSNLRVAFHAAGMRLAIYRELESRYDHPDVERLFKAVKPRVPRISLFTVYRTMNALESAGMIWRVATWRGHARYDANVDVHAHFLCEKCGRIDDVEAGAVSMPASPLAETGAAVRRVEVMMTGTCAVCGSASSGALQA